MSKTLLILNDPSYGTERSYNALRLAGSLPKREGEHGWSGRGSRCGSARSSESIPSDASSPSAVRTSPVTFL